MDGPAAARAARVATSGGTQEGRIYYRVCTGSESSPLALTQSVINKQTAIIVVYRGVSTTTPIDAWASRQETVAGTTHANPQVTTVAANAPATTFIMERFTDSSPNYTPPTGYTERANPTPAGGGGSTSAAAADDGLAVARGAGTNVTPPAWSNGVSTNNVLTWTITLTPADGGTSREGTGSGSATGAGTSTGSKSTAGTGSGSATSAAAAGTGTKSGYGTGTGGAVGSGTGTGFTTKVNWGVAIDWDGDGFTSADDVTARVLARGGLTAQYGRDQTRELSPMAAGAGDFEIDNASRDYSPDNLASPLVGKLLPGRSVRIRATSGSTSLNENPTFDTTVAGWTGHLCTVAHSTAQVHPDGVGSMLITPDGGNPACGGGSGLVPVTPRAGYSASLWAYSPGGWDDIRVLINWSDSSEVFLGSSVGAAVAVPAGEWTEVAWSFTAPDEAAFASVWAWQSANPTAGDAWYAWDVRVAPDESVATMLQGFVDDYDLKPAPKERSVAFTLLDAVAKLRGAKATTRLHQGVRTGTAIGYVLDAIGWPSHLRDLDPGATTARWWWVEDADAFEAIQDLVRAEGPPAMLTSDELGRIVFRDRHHRILSPRATRSYATFTDQPTDPLYMMALTYDHGWGDIVNSVSVKVEEKDPAALPDEVWQEESLIQLGADEVRVIRPTLTSPVVRPFAIYGVQTGSVSHSLTVDSGQTLTLQLTAGASGAIVSNLSIQAQAVATARTYTILLEDAESIAQYGKRSLDYEVPWAGVHDATAVATLVLAASAQRRPIVTIKLQSMTHAMTPRLAQQLIRALSDRVHVVEAETCVDHDFHIESIDQRVEANGLSLETDFGLERAVEQADNVFRFDDPDYGFDNGVFATNGLSDPETLMIFDEDGRGFGDGVFAT
ncbi:hypothetical protein BJF79_13865 [Actinomadura sp. CNU-125]|uniref:hypothetical protein n=1 Tax=Actinomadura sp. CNU-125 TaxID=1904961 RepID=UPI00095C4BF0|nr:hypothetical protein [Actinomadura sp. CNU-125]OLT24424.1 hypothetical protein BJF79_13865 [Actinomadura sp. CNU-125]